MRQIKYWFNNLVSGLEAFWKFRMVVPQGVVIRSATNIQVGKNFNLGEYCQLFCQDPERGSRLVIGNGVSLNNFVMLIADGGGTITIGDHVLIGPMSVLRAANHRFEDIQVPVKNQGHKPGHINIGEDVWLGAHVTVLPNVTIGRSSIIGAGSVVTRDIPPYSVAVGVPAQVVRSRKT